MNELKISQDPQRALKLSHQPAGIAAVVFAVATMAALLTARNLAWGSAIASMKYFLRCETCGEESVRMSTFELTFSGEQTTEVPGLASSPEAQFYFMHSDHVVYIVSDWLPAMSDWLLARENKASARANLRRRLAAWPASRRSTHSSVIPPAFRLVLDSTPT